MSLQYNSYSKCQESEYQELPPIVSCHGSSDNNTISPKSIYGLSTSLPGHREEYKPEMSTFPPNSNRTVPGLNYVLSHLDNQPSRSPSLPPSTYYSTHTNTLPGSPNSSHHEYSKSKPAVGSKEWVRLRRENHKEVERKRRDCINDNINVLGDLVPGPEKNKGGILSRVVAHINDLRERNARLKEEKDRQAQHLHATIQDLSRNLSELEEENAYLKSRLMNSSHLTEPSQPT